MTDTTGYAQRVREVAERLAAVRNRRTLHNAESWNRVVADYILIAELHLQMTAEAIAIAMCTEWNADHINQYLIDNGYKKETMGKNKEYPDNLRRLAEEIAEATNKNTAYHLPRTAATHAARIALEFAAVCVQTALQQVQHWGHHNHQITTLTDRNER